MSLLSPPARDTAQATILTLIAGIADAMGYITMGGVFAANMTGNTVLAGIAAAQRHYPDAGDHLTPLLAFFIGAMLSRLLLRLAPRPAACLVAEAALPALAGLPPPGPGRAGWGPAVGVGGGRGRARALAFLRARRHEDRGPGLPRGWVRGRVAHDAGLGRADDGLPPAFLFHRQRRPAAPRHGRLDIGVGH